MMPLSNAQLAALADLASRGPHRGKANVQRALAARGLARPLRDGVYAITRDGLDELRERARLAAPDPLTAALIEWNAIPEDVRRRALDVLDIDSSSFVTPVAHAIRALVRLGRAAVQ